MLAAHHVAKNKTQNVNEKVERFVEKMGKNIEQKNNIMISKFEGTREKSAENLYRLFARGVVGERARAALHI